LNIWNLKNKAFYGLILFILDLLMLAGSASLAYYLRYYTKIFGSDKPTYLIDKHYVVYTIIFICIFLLVSVILRLHNWENIYKKPYYYLKLLITPFISILLLIIIGKAYENFSFSRIWLLLIFIFTFFLLLFYRYIIAVATKRFFQREKIIIENLYFTPVDNLIYFRRLSRKKKNLAYGLVLFLSDIIFLGLSFYMSYFLRFRTVTFSEANKIYLIEVNYFIYSIVFIVSALLIFAIHSLYDKDKIYRGSGYYTRIIRAIFINIIVIILAGYIFNLFTFSRKWILLLFILSIVLVLLGRMIIDRVTQKISRVIKIYSKTIIVGIGENAKRIENSLKKYAYEDDIVVGHVDKKQRILKGDEYTRNLTILGYLEDLSEIINKNNIQRVIISSPEFKYFEILEILENLKGMDITTLIFPGFFEFSLRRLSVREIGGVPLMQVSNIGFFGINLFLKNFIDYVFGTIIFIIFIPIYLFVGMLIKIDSRGPVLFEQRRMTKDCRMFYMYKFRTMYVDAEERLKELMKYNEADGPLFKMKNDPRITRIGRFLRKFSIDEIPQIINVLRGELSIVGPRPPLPIEVEKYDEWEMKRMNVKQGITGLWQVSGRSDLSFEEMARLDLYYIQNWSIEMDIKIMLKTIPAVLSRKGAY
jgi:exopolysaccharide biosynthesis polyprenyl glycosylphosphotransferase